VLHELDLRIEKGEFVAIVGFSGSGKTTLVSLLAGLIQADSGDVLKDGQPITEPGPDRGIVFQNGSSDSLSRILVAVFTIGIIGFALDRLMQGLQTLAARR